MKLSDSGKRKGRKVGAPWCRSREDDRQSIRLTRNGFGFEQASLPDIDAEVGIDSGRTTVAVLSDGEMITSPTFLRRAERELRSRSSSTEPATHLGHMCAAVAAGHTLVACPIAPS